MPGPAPAVTPRLVAPLEQALPAWLKGAQAWIRAGDPAAADALMSRPAEISTPRAVIIGETNRGKSSLINALLGMPGLSPVDAGVATATYLLFRHADAPRAVVKFGRGFPDMAIPIGRIGDWATVEGEGDPDLPPPRWIEVSLPAEVLRRADLIDTPGVGGLVAAHAELAAEAAATAAALLFVVDASAPLTGGELAFLAGAAERVDTVHFVITKTDAFRGWRQIVEADRALLAQHAPRFADATFHPVSARLAQAASDQADPKVAEVLRTQSGIAALREVLTVEVAARAALLRDANEVRTTITVIGGGLVTLDSQRSALTASAAEAERLKERREELINQRKSGGRSWQVLLRAETQRARIELSGEIAREVREASAMFRGAIDNADNDELKKMPFHVDAYAQAMTQRARARLEEAMARLCQRVLNDLFTPEELQVLIGTLAVRPYETFTTRGPDRNRSMDETIMTLGGAGMGFTLSKMALALPLGLVPALGVILTPVSIVLGGAAAWYMIRSRRRMADKTRLKQWLGEVLGEARAQIDQNVAAQFVEADQQLTLALDDALGRQVSAIDTQLKEVDGALKLDAVERSTRIRGVDERKAAGASIIAEGEALLGRIRATAGTPLAPDLAAALAGVFRSAAVPPMAAGLGPVAAPAAAPLPQATLPPATVQQAPPAPVPPAAAIPTTMLPAPPAPAPPAPLPAFVVPPAPPPPAGQPAHDQPAHLTMADGRQLVVPPGGFRAVVAPAPGAPSTPAEPAAATPAEPAAAPDRWLTVAGGRRIVVPEAVSTVLGARNPDGPGTGPALPVPPMPVPMPMPVSTPVPPEPAGRTADTASEAVVDAGPAPSAPVAQAWPEPPASPAAAPSTPPPTPSATSPLASDDHRQ